jgi:hypothetical protein
VNCTKIIHNRKINNKRWAKEREQDRQRERPGTVFFSRADILGLIKVSS